MVAPNSGFSVLAVPANPLEYATSCVTVLIVTWQGRDSELHKHGQVEHRFFIVTLMRRSALRKDCSQSS